MLRCLRHGNVRFVPSAEWFQTNGTEFRKVYNLRDGIVYRVWFDGLVAETDMEPDVVRQLCVPCDPIAL